MEKNFVPFELAVKLKELGFHEECFARWFKVGEEKPILLYNTVPSSENGDIITIAPLFQQAFNWAREKGIAFHIEPDNDWGCGYIRGYIPFVADKNNEREQPIYVDGDCMDYEQARIICLKKIIEILEKK